MPLNERPACAADAIATRTPGDDKEHRCEHPRTRRVMTLTLPGLTEQLLRIRRRDGTRLAGHTESAAVLHD